MMMMTFEPLVHPPFFLPFFFDSLTFLFPLFFFSSTKFFHIPVLFSPQHRRRRRNKRNAKFGSVRADSTRAHEASRVVAFTLFLNNLSLSLSLSLSLRRLLGSQERRELIFINFFQSHLREEKKKLPRSIHVSRERERHGFRIGRR